MVKADHTHNTDRCSHSYTGACVGGIMSLVSVPGPLLAVMVLLVLVVVLFSCVLRKRRQTEGSYQPSAEEKKQAKNHGPEKPGLALPLPKEERLI